MGDGRWAMGNPRSIAAPTSPRRDLCRVLPIAYRLSPPFLAKLEFVVDDQRRVIREAPVLVDRHRVRMGGDARRGDLVVDAPADVLRPGLAPVRPPGVLLGTRVDAPEDVDEPELV